MRPIKDPARSFDVTKSQGAPAADFAAPAPAGLGLF
jgi:hypothetical protein